MRLVGIGPGEGDKMSGDAAAPSPQDRPPSLTLHYRPGLVLPALSKLSLRVAALIPDTYWLWQHTLGRLGDQRVHY